MSISVNKFGTLADGREVTAYTMTSECGIEVTVLNMGGILHSIKMPDKNGNVADILCGFDTADEYDQKSGYFGALVGRYANRIGKGKFTIDGVEYNVGLNNNGNSLHGGVVGFNKKFWNVETGVCKTCGADKLVLTCTSADGEEGFPGKVEVSVVYALDSEGELTIKYHAEADKKTPIALTNHAYFNMAGCNGGTVLDQELTVNADAICEIDDLFIATGTLIPVEGTAFDFTETKTIGRDIGADDIQLKRAGGYDHGFNLTGKGETMNWRGKKEITFAAKLKDPASGRTVKLYTDAPALQVYTGNMIDCETFKGNVPAVRNGGVCLETGNLADSPNHDNFPSCIYGPDKNYDCLAVFKFSIEA